MAIIERTHSRLGSIPNYRNRFDRPILYYPKFYSITQSVPATLWLSYAITTACNLHGWFPKTMEEMKSETGLTRYQQASAREVLRSLGILLEWKANVPMQIYFKVDFRRLDQLLEGVA